MFQYKTEENKIGLKKKSSFLLQINPMQKQEQKSSANESNRNNQKKSSTQCNYEQLSQASGIVFLFLFFIALKKVSHFYYCYFSNQILCYGRKDGIQKKYRESQEIAGEWKLKGINFCHSVERLGV